MNTLKTVLLHGILLILSLIPPRIAGGVGAGMGRVAFYLDSRHRSIAIRNITRIYPDQPRSWRTRTARESFAELGRTMMELPHVFMRSKEFLRSRVQIEGEEELRAALRHDKGALIAACHHSNWELGAQMLSILGFTNDLFYRPLRQSAFDTFIKSARERFGAQLHARQESLRWVPKALKKQSCIGLMIDQHIGDGMAVPFLGHLANTLTLPATLTHKYGVPVIGVALHRIGRSFRFRMQLWHIEAPANRSDERAFTYQFTHRICKSFEPIIHQRPEMWLWSHQRWKLLEEHEKEISEAVYGTP